MTELLPLADKYFYHNILSLFMIPVWLFFGIKGFKLNNEVKKYKFSIFIIILCLLQESIDFINRIFFDANYLFSIQRDLPFLQFCQVSFYFSLFCIYISSKQNSELEKKYSIKQFYFDCAFLLGFSGAFQGILTPDFLNINNLIGVICIQLQHSLIILNLIWLMCAYNYKLTFKGVCLTYLFINIIAPFALLLNKFLGKNLEGYSANYFYVNELPQVDNFLLNFVSQYPSPEYILYIQPIFIFYFSILYLPFLLFNRLKKEIK